MAEHRAYFLAVLAGTMVLAAALRLPGLGNTALTNDEAYTWRVTQYPLFDLLERTRHDGHPPFSYLVLQAWQQLCGSSVWALRGLSVLLAVLTVPLTYAVCMEALRLGGDKSALAGAAADGDKRGRLSGRAGAVLSAFLLAVHASQVVQGKNGRMYSLGVCLAALTAWLLLKALNENRQRWWAGYGLAAAALALTHYYGLFTLAAQGVFAGGWLLWRARPRWRVGLTWRDAGAAGRLGGLLYAGLVGAVLFAPWVSAFQGQVADVRDGFWIPPVSFEQVKQVFWPWCTGLPYLDRWETWAWLSVLVLCLGWTVLGRDAAAWFFLLQAALPWACAVALSVIWKRSIFYDRYLSFAQWALLCYWGVTVARFPGWPARLLLGSFIAASAVAGIDIKIPSGPPAIAQAAAFLKEHVQPGDQVWVNGAAEVNRLRYYASRAGLPNLWVRGHVALGQKGHNVHVASLCGEDILESDAMQNPPARFWQAGDSGGYAPAGTMQVLEAAFQDDTGRYSVALYERVGGKEKNRGQKNNCGAYCDEGAYEAQHQYAKVAGRSRLHVSK